MMYLIYQIYQQACWCIGDALMESDDLPRKEWKRSADISLYVMMGRTRVGGSSERTNGKGGA